MKLSKRERECLYYFLSGKSRKEIGKAMHVSSRTVDRYFELIKNKWKCHTKMAIVKRSIEEGFITIHKEFILSVPSQSSTE